MSRKRKSANRKDRYQQDAFEQDFETRQTFMPQKKKSPPFRAITEAQGHYATQITSKDIVFGVGPAGTGKTYVAASLAAEALEKGQIERIILCRPMVGCGEDMGHLPGDMAEKYEPWCEPIMDVLRDRLGVGPVKMFLKSGVIQTKPLMFMRGKTNANCWVILDEAQNATPDQMKMFLTRIGEGAKLIIDGDYSQSDLKDRRGVRQMNGLEDAIQRLQKVPEIGVTHFGAEDIVRHDLIQKIVTAYEKLL